MAHNYDIFFLRGSFTKKKVLRDFFPVVPVDKALLFLQKARQKVLIVAFEKILAKMRDAEMFLPKLILRYDFCQSTISFYVCMQT